MEYWWAYPLVGLLCGIFSATFGVGSGILLIPILVLVFSMPQKSAQGVCLAVMVPMALAGAIRYRMNPNIEVNFLVVGLLSAGAVAGALIGASIAGWAPGIALRRLFAVIMIIAAIRMLTASPAKKAPSRPGAPETVAAEAADSNRSGMDASPNDPAGRPPTDEDPPQRA